MAAWNKFHVFVEDLAEGKHNLGADTITLALTNTAPTAANAVLSDIAQIAYTNLPSSRVLTVTSSAQSAGTYGLSASDKVLTASGVVPTFRYVVVYNATPAGGPLIGWYDRGSPVDMIANDTFTVDLPASLLTLA